MKKELFLALSVFVAVPVFAQSTTSSTTGVNGTGVQITGAANQTLGNRTATITLGNGQAPKVSSVKGGATGGATSAGTFSAGLSIGATLGSGFGNTGGTAGSQAGGLGGF